MIAKLFFGDHKAKIIYYDHTTYISYIHSNMHMIISPVLLNLIRYRSDTTNDQYLIRDFI